MSPHFVPRVLTCAHARKGPDMPPHATTHARPHHFLNLTQAVDTNKGIVMLNGTAGRSRALAEAQQPAAGRGERAG